VVGHHLEAVVLNQGVGEIPGHGARVAPATSVTSTFGRATMTRADVKRTCRLLDHGPLGLLDDLRHGKFGWHLQDAHAADVAIQFPRIWPGVRVLNSAPPGDCSSSRG